MIVPALTLLPSKTFTPRRCALESRPLRVEPPPLVFDMARPQPFVIDGDLDACVLLAVTPAAPLVGACACR